MTGYARAQGSDERRRWVWEARSVNGRNLEIRCRVPQGFDRLENPARTAIGGRMKRGNVSLTLTIASEQQGKPLRINRALLAELAGLVEEVRKGTGAAAPTADGLLRVRGVIEEEERCECCDEVAAHRVRSYPRVMAVTRCTWAGDDDLMVAYHDEEWGIPSHDDRHLFEHLTLEGAQSGLSWMTILRKREGYRRAFAGFDAEAVARFSARDIERLLADPGIVRNRAKVESTVANAHAVLAVQEEHGSLDAFLWGLVGGAPTVNRWRLMSEIPAETPESHAFSKELKRRGFRFLGPTTCYAFIQSVGMVNREEPVAEIIRELAGEAAAALESRG